MTLTNKVQPNKKNLTLNQNLLFIPKIIALMTMNMTMKVSMMLGIHFIHQRDQEELQDSNHRFQHITIKNIKNKTIPPEHQPVGGVLNNTKYPKVKTFSNKMANQHVVKYVKASITGHHNAQTKTLMKSTIWFTNLSFKIVTS